MVNNATHSKGNILDTNIDYLISNILITPSSNQLLSSDHFFISFDVCHSIPSLPNTTRYALDYPKGDYDALNEFIANYDLSFCSFLDVDSAWSKLKQILSEGCSRYIPKVKLKPHDPPKWFNSSIRHHLNCIHSLRCRFRNSPSPSLSDKLHQQEQQLQNLMTQTRIQYEENLVADYKNNCKAIHHHLNQIKKSSGIPQQVYLNDRSAITPLVQANLFNEYFHSVYGTSSTSSFLPNSPPTTECLSDITISEEDVFQILSSLDPSKAMGILTTSAREFSNHVLSLYLVLYLFFFNDALILLVFRMSGKFMSSHLFSKKATLLMFPIIDLYLCCVPSPKY